MDQSSFGILAHNLLRAQPSLSGSCVKAHEVEMA